MFGRLRIWREEANKLNFVKFSPPLNHTTEIELKKVASPLSGFRFAHLSAS